MGRSSFEFDLQVSKNELPLIKGLKALQRASIRSIIPLACAGVTRKLKIAKQLSTKNHRKSMQAGLTLTNKIPPSKGHEIKHPVRDRVENDIKIVLTAVWEYCFVL